MIAILKDADATARRRFTYKAETVDQWRSFASTAMAGKPWSGDCDDLASTTCHIAIIKGAKKADLWFATVSSTRSGKVDHLIALGRDEQGVFWVIGDTFGPTYRLSSMEHELIDVHNLSWPVTSWKRYGGVGGFLASV